MVGKFEETIQFTKVRIEMPVPPLGLITEILTGRPLNDIVIIEADYFDFVYEKTAVIIM